MLDAIERIRFGEDADSKISLFKMAGEHYLIRHSPFAFAKLTEEYKNMLARLCEPNVKARESDSKISPTLKKFLNEKIKAKTKKEHCLRRLNLIVAQKCNSRCRYCYAGEGNYGEDVLMPQQVAQMAIESALKHYDRVENIQFFGGEPFLASGVIEDAITSAETIATILQKPIPIFTAVTNLTILPSKILKLVRQGKLNIIASLDGPQKVHDYNRRLSNGRPTYRAVVRNISRLEPFSQPKTIQATYTAYHMDTGFSPRSTKDHINSVCPKAHVVIVPSLNLPYRIGESIFHSDLISYCTGKAGCNRHALKKILNSYSALFESGARGDIFCDLGVSNFTVDARGKVWACQILCNKTTPLGTITNNWDSIKKRFESGMGKMLRKSNFPACRNCFLKEYCTQCPIAWQRDKGNMSPIESQCQMDRRAFFTACRLSLILQKDESL